MPGLRAPASDERCRLPGCGLLLRVPLATQLMQTLRTADLLLARLQEVSHRPAAPAPAYPSPPVSVVLPPPLPRPASTGRRGISAVSVPKLLLGLGALCLLVAAVIWVLADPVTPRAARLGAAASLGLVLLGTRLRWTAPVLVGAGVGTLIVLRELAPYAAEIPQWVLIGLAGTVLTVVGITWERRLRDLRAASAYVGRLR